MLLLLNIFVYLKLFLVEAFEHKLFGVFCINIRKVIKDKFFITNLVLLERGKDLSSFSFEM